MSTLGERLRQARENKNLTQQEVAERAGMSQPTYYKIESGKTKRTTYLNDLARVLSVSADWLATGEGSMTADIKRAKFSQRAPKLIPDFAPDGATVYNQNPYKVNYDTVICRQILDDSMNTFFMLGDFVFADTTVKPETGGYVIARLEDNSEVVRSYKEYHDPALGILQKELIAENKERFPNIKFSDRPFEIMGTIFEHKRFLGASLKRLGLMAADNELAYLVTQELERQKNTSGE